MQVPVEYLEQISEFTRNKKPTLAVSYLAHILEHEEYAEVLHAMYVIEKHVGELPSDLGLVRDGILKVLLTHCATVLDKTEITKLTNCFEITKNSPVYH